MEHSLPNFAPGRLGFAFGLTLLAGLATGLGSALTFFARWTNLRLPTWSLAFSEGVMLYLSFMEILPKATDSLARALGEGRADWWAALGFFGGLALMALIVPTFTLLREDEPRQIGRQS